MGIELARITAVEPVVGAEVPAEITRKIFLLVWGREDKRKRMRVGAVVDFERLGGALAVNLKAAGVAAKGEAGGVAAARFAGGGAYCKDVEGVNVRWVADAARHVRTGEVQDVVAYPA